MDRFRPAPASIPVRASTAYTGSMLIAFLLLASTATAEPQALLGAPELPLAARSALSGREAAALERFLDGWNDAARWAAPRAPGAVTFSAGPADAQRQAPQGARPEDRALAGLARAERAGFPRAVTVGALRKLASGEGQLAQDARALIRDLGMAAFE